MQYVLSPLPSLRWTLAPLVLMEGRSSKRGSRGASRSPAGGKKVTSVSFWLSLILSIAGYLGRCSILAYLIYVIFLNIEFHFILFTFISENPNS